MEAADQHRSRIWINAAESMNRSWQELMASQRMACATYAQLWAFMNSVNLALKTSIQKNREWNELDTIFKPMGYGVDLIEPEELQCRIDVITEIMRQNGIAARSEEEEDDGYEPPVKKASNISQFFGGGH